jgi:hypothetical protein
LEVVMVDFEVMFLSTFAKTSVAFGKSVVLVVKLKQAIASVTIKYFILLIL